MEATHENMQATGLMKKVYRPVYFHLTPLVFVFVLLAVLAAYWAYDAYLLADMRTSGGRLITFIILGIAIWISSGEYRKATPIELNQTELYFGNGIQIKWKDISSIDFKVYSMAPVLIVASSGSQYVIPLDAYRKRFILMGDVAEHCSHLAWRPPSRLEYHTQKYLDLAKGAGVVVSLMLIVFGGVGLSTQALGIDHVKILAGILFACGAVITSCGLWVDKRVSAWPLWINWSAVILGTTIMIGSILYVWKRNNSFLVHAFSIGAFLVIAASLLLRCKANNSDRKE